MKHWELNSLDDRCMSVCSVCFPLLCFNSEIQKIQRDKGLALQDILDDIHRLVHKSKVLTFFS